MDNGIDRSIGYKKYHVEVKLKFCIEAEDVGDAAKIIESKFIGDKIGNLPEYSYKDLKIVKHEGEGHTESLY